MSHTFEELDNNFRRDGFGNNVFKRVRETGKRVRKDNVRNLLEIS
jgi:hypothetical protein